MYSWNGQIDSRAPVVPELHPALRIVRGVSAGILIVLLGLLAMAGLEKTFGLLP